MAKTYHSLRVLAAAAAGGVLVAVAMLMLTVLVMDEPAGAAFPGKNGKIAFVCSAEICTMNPNGQGVDTLTNNSVGDFSPAWSPGGGKIAFVSTRDDAKGEIYTMNANGQGVDRLTNNSAFDSAPAWSAAGNRIAFVSNRDGNYEIYTMSPTGQGIDRLTNNAAGDGDPNWSPGGGKIAFVSNRTNNTDIYTMNANGQGLAPITTKNSNSPDWQPLSSAPQPGPPNKKTAPKVLSTFPKANAKGVAPAASLRATFSEKMRASSINGKTFKLFKKKKGSTKKLSARVTYNAATKKATLNPTTSLRRDLTYRAVVTTGAKDVAGNRLDQKRTTKGLKQKVWAFTVRR